MTAPPDGLERRRGRDRRRHGLSVLALAPTPPVRHIRAHMFEFLTALTLLAAGVLFFTDQTHFIAGTALGRNLHLVDEVWYAGFVAGGPLVAAGLWFDHRLVLGGRILGRGLEVLGLAVLAGATAIAAAAYYINLGPSYGALIQTALSLSYAHRAYSLTAGRQVHVPVPVPWKH